MTQRESSYWVSPAVALPTRENMTKLSDELGLQCSGDDINDILGHFKEYRRHLQQVYELPDISIPVKYPRTPGHRPSHTENTCNAWAWRCEVKGSSSGLLAGKRVGVKDCIAVAGVPMMNGSRLLEGYIPEFDATVVTRVLDAGAIVTGKTSCEDLCISGSSFLNALGPVKNPCDRSRDCGGSSSGCAALLSLGEIDLAIGADQMGSIRVPSAWTGMVGMLPTFGLVPYTGAATIENCRDVIGPMARDVRACALLLQVIAGYDDNNDSRQCQNMKIPKYSERLDDGIRGKRVCLLKEGFDVCTEVDVVKIVQQAAHLLAEGGTTVDEVTMPEHKDALSIGFVLGVEGTYNAMIKGNGGGHFSKGFYPLSYIEAFDKAQKARPHEFSPLVKSFALFSEYMNRMYGHKFYAKAQNMALKLRRLYDKILEEYDVLIMPTVTRLPPVLPAKNATYEDILDRAVSMFGNTCPFNLTGHPALTINAGYCRGLPVGMMIVGRHFEDLTVLQVAREFEKSRDSHVSL